MTANAPEFLFVPPPEAPVFKPTWEEFQDALGYINKIRPVAEQSGICKIIPPPDWQPPFAVDVDNFNFTPRIQRLNELEAHTRIKLNFLDQIAKFWELQGSSLKIPVVERKALDLYSLHKHVHAEGGSDHITKERKWNRVASRMGFPNNKNLGTLLKTHYERIVLPYDIFTKGKSIKVKRDDCDDVKNVDPIDKDYKPHKIPSRMAGKIPDNEKNGRRSKRYPENQSDSRGESDEEGKNSKELKRLQFYGAGPKMAGFDTETPPEEKAKTRGKKIDFYDYDPLAKYICLNCGRGDAEDQMLLCDGCDDSYHTFCLMPRLPEIPKGDWRCPKCVAVEVSKPLEAFGFEQAQKEYTLQSFGEMADKFKQDYFNMPVHLVPVETAEREFWRIVSSIDEDVTVEYGADLHTMDHGSGFPTKNSKNLLPADQEYSTSSWNLNNLPIVEGSILGHINCDISGMKVPWMYVGMCFSTFCWHNEDHWSYSINYLHWGEPKTWYGVPGSKAEEFETAMRGAAPELFDIQPDLLHQLVTIMNPNIVMKAGVPIVRTDQHAGEFVITFPRSYHAGFNQGYNFAEAVNFCPPDWLPIGRECVSHYSNLKRLCVFSHDELVCKMATVPDKLDLTVAAATYQDLLKMVELEKKLRRNLLMQGITNAEREAFELLPDDERQCDFCKTTCFLSAITCSCTADKIVCLRHYKQLCECKGENKTLRYRYTLDDLPPMLKSLKIRAESFDNWAAKVKESLEAEGEDKLDLPELRELVEEAESQKFPDSELLQTLIQAVTEAEKCETVAAHLATKKVRTRTRGTNEPKARLTLEELRLFHEQIESLACVIKEGDAVKELIARVDSFQGESRKLLQEENPDAEALSKQVEIGFGLDIDLPEITQIRHKLHQVEWLDKVEESIEDKDTLNGEMIKKLLDEAMALPPSPKIERMMAELLKIQTQIDVWEEKVNSAIAKGLTLEEGEHLISEIEDIPAFMPANNTLKEAVKKAREWIAKVDAFDKRDQTPFLEIVESLVTRGKPIPVKLEKLPLLEENIAEAYQWLEKTSRTFLKKNSHFSLLEILLPRTDIGLVANKKKRVKKDDSSPQQLLMLLLDITSEDIVKSSSIVKAYKECEERELKSVRAIRSHNNSKSLSDETATFCICHKGVQGTMIQCSLCLDQFHMSCVPSFLRHRLRTGTQHRFLCPSCERSKRPKLETILSLLMYLQKLPLRLPEAEALQCLTERAMSWQDKARSLLHAEECKTALAKLSAFSSKLSDAQKQKELCGILTKKKVEDGESGIDSKSDCDEKAWEQTYISCKTKAEKKKMWNITLSSFMKTDGLLVTLKEESKQVIQDLLIASDLLEVTLEETSHFVKILEASKHPPSQLEDVLLSLSSSNPSPSVASDDTRIVRKLSLTSPGDSLMTLVKKRKSEGIIEDIVNPRSPVRSPVKKLKYTMQERSRGIVRKRSAAAKAKDTTVRTKGTKQQFKSRDTLTSTSDDDEGGEETEDTCAAEACRKPFGSNVQWVQCDGCDLWFHYLCVGLCQKDISKDEDYLCAACLNQQIKTCGESTEEEDILEPSLSGSLQKE